MTKKEIEKLEIEEYEGDGIDRIFRNVPENAPYPIVLYFTTTIICWISSGIMLISGIIIAAPPGK